MKKPTVIKCYRCGKRCRDPRQWNVEFIASIELGAVCPDCQTAEEHLGAEVNLAMGAHKGIRHSRIDTPEGLGAYIEFLLTSYPTADVMRSKADIIAVVRKDEHASEVVRLMRRLADDLEKWDQRAELGPMLERIQSHREFEELAADVMMPLAMAIQRMATPAADGSLGLNIDELSDDDAVELYRLASAAAAELDR